MGKMKTDKMNVMDNFHGVQEIRCKRCGTMEFVQMMFFNHICWQCPKCNAEHITVWDNEANMPKTFITHYSESRIPYTHGKMGSRDVTIYGIYK